ncbi:thioredoxin family protein [Pseudalkalibacillus caeni]|uniref:Thioredoxin family protein n=1 Tax=Exobacillus caeni TaxID=2574798 RepID=A0A5R9FDW6_9BACL|nr:thioredoxin family protein [Pseudalkalibacillus caeni]TLS39073.1 thioredoxin family protein [Pseudalkalibacillus caeni]
MRKFDSKEEYQKKIQEGVSVLLFSADWCPDCRVIEPFLPELEEKFDSYDFYYVDRDEMIDYCQELDIFGIPSFVVFQDGEEVDRFVGKQRKSRQEIESFLENLPLK